MEENDNLMLEERERVPSNDSVLVNEFLKERVPPEEEPCSLDELRASEPLCAKNDDFRFSFVGVSDGGGVFDRPDALFVIAAGDVTVADIRDNKFAHITFPSEFTVSTSPGFPRGKSCTLPLFPPMSRTFSGMYSGIRSSLEADGELYAPPDDIRESRLDCFPVGILSMNRRMGERDRFSCSAGASYAT